MTPHHLKGPRQGHFSRMESWMPGTGSRPCQAHFSAKPVGLTTSHAICSNGGGLLLLVWSSASATSLQKQFCLASVLTSKQQSNPGLGPGHRKGLVRGYFGHWWLLLVWSSARATSLQKQFCLSSTLPDK